MEQNVLTDTNLVGYGEKYVGKVRDVYRQPERLILITTDRHSSFDRIIAHIPWKGQVLNQLSVWWFDQTKDIVPNHVIAIPDPNVTIARVCTPLPIEAVVRGYITGVTDTSLWTHYAKGKRDFGNFTLPDGLQKNQKLERSVFTPSTKSDTHDQTLSPDEMVASNIISRGLIDTIEAVATALYERGAAVAAERGLILVDTKYEFGIDAGGELMLIDELHTPDSSRFWEASSYEERFAQGMEPEYFDKEFLRLWFKEHSDPYRDETLPQAPADMVEELSRRYLSIAERITGEPFEPGATPILKRIADNISSYAVH